MQLVAGQVGQEYNRRKKRHGAYWEDRYHATAIENDSHLVKCLTYIDMNMVRTGVVQQHESKWSQSVAVGSKAFVEKIKNELGTRAVYRKINKVDESYELREKLFSYSTNFNPNSEQLSEENSYS